MAIHVEETFHIEGVELSTLGAETDGNALWVYQEAVLDTLPTPLRIDARMLRTLHPDHINAVDVKVDGRTQSLRFGADDGPKSVEF